MDTVKLLPIEGCDCTEPWGEYDDGELGKNREDALCNAPYGSCSAFHPIAPDAASPEAPKGKQDFSGDIDGAGYKGSMDNPSKPPLSLLSRSALWAIAAVMGKGALKYARGNWMRGMSFSEVADAAMRHLTAWIDGEDNDPETGLSHLAHVGCCIMFLLHYTHGRRKEEYVRFDDRIYSR